jgi:hypothetical protein
MTHRIVLNSKEFVRRSKERILVPVGWLVNLVWKLLRRLVGDDKR